MEMKFYDFTLLLLIGPAGCGKSSFAARHFDRAEVLTCRGCPAEPAASDGPFAELLQAAGARLAARLPVVVDADNLHPAARRPLLALARQYHTPTAALVFDLPRSFCLDADRGRAAPPETLESQLAELRKTRPALKNEGYGRIYTLREPAELDQARVLREPLPCDKRVLPGPFDLIGDVHGCASELETLLERLGYTYTLSPARFPGDYTRRYQPPPGRMAIFIGDLVDRGPRILDSFQIARAMLQAGQALCVLGNHDEKLLRKLRGNDVRVTHGLEATLQELEALPPVSQSRLRAEMLDFFAGLPSHLVLDGGRLVAVHAGIRTGMIGRESKRIRDFALYGETTGEADEYGLPVRNNWAARYDGSALIVYGHTAVQRPEWLNNTVDIDTGCVYGGSLTALRYPEREMVQVAAERVYRVSARPLQQNAP